MADSGPSAEAPRPKPFLKWAGGKRQLLPVIRTYYPPLFENYLEPFVGSGAVFFDLLNRGALEGRHATLLDTNPDLIGCYTMIRDELDAVLRHLEQFSRAHRSSPRETYYGVRETVFNHARSTLRRQVTRMSAAYTPELAAALIYLNRTAFNGLFRLNAKGDFNVPLGRYQNPTICDVATLSAVSHALAHTKVMLRESCFEDVAGLARPGDFVYFDPPYAPVSSTAVFTSYTAGGFDEADQLRLQGLVIALASRGCHVLMSNSTAPLITALYADSPAARAAGLRSRTVPARRAINSDASRRGAVLEYLISNFDPGSETA